MFWYRNPCDEALRRHIEELGRDPIAYIAFVLSTAEVPYDRMNGAEEVAKIFFNSGYSTNFIFSFNRAMQYVHPAWNLQYGEIAARLIRIEGVLKDKSKTDGLFEDNRQIKTKTYEYNEHGFRQAMQESARYVVIKPKDGSRGEGLKIVDKFELPKDMPEYNPNLIAEAFMPSKPIYSPKDRQQHDGCMRYVVFVEQDKSGNIKLFHFGGYWRLSPHAITDKLDLDAMRANLAQGAIAEKVSKEDLMLVRGTLEMELPGIYRKLIKREC